MNLADRVGEIALEWFSCRADPSQRRKETITKHFDEGDRSSEEVEENGMELDEQDLLQATYQLQRV